MRGWGTRSEQSFTAGTPNKEGSSSSVSVLHDQWLKSSYMFTQDQVSVITYMAVQWVGCAGEIDNVYISSDIITHTGQGSESTWPIPQGFIVY